MEDQLSCEAAPYDLSIFVESSRGVGGARLVSAAQSHVLSDRHRKRGTLQDHRAI